MEYLSLIDVVNMWLGDEQRILDWISTGIIPAPKLINGRARWEKSVYDAWEDSHYRSQEPPIEELEEIFKAIYCELYLEPKLAKRKSAAS
jgi:hypothetical protein